MDAFSHPQHCARRGGACLEDLHGCRYPPGQRFRVQQGCADIQVFTPLLLKFHPRLQYGSYTTYLDVEDFREY